MSNPGTRAALLIATALMGWLVGGLLVKPAPSATSLKESFPQKRKVLTALIAKPPRDVAHNYSDVLTTRPSVFLAMSIELPSVRKYAVDLAINGSFSKDPEDWYQLLRGLSEHTPTYISLATAILRLGARMEIDTVEVASLDNWIYGETFDKEELLIEALLAASSGEPEKFVELAQKVGPRDSVRGFVTSKFGTELAQQLPKKEPNEDEEKTLASLDELLEGFDHAEGKDERSELIDSIIERMVAEDIDQAFEWAEKLADIAERDAALSEIWSVKRSYRFFGYSTKSRDDVIELRDIYLRCFTEHSGSTRYRFSTNSYEWSLAQADIELAADTFKQLEGKPRRQALLGGLLVEWGASDPDAAAAFVDGLVDSKERSQALRYLGLQWVAGQPRDAAQWATSLQDENERSEMIGRVIERWAAVDSRAALQWVEDLRSDDPARDGGLSSVVDWLQWSHPDEVYQLASRFSDPQEELSVRSSALQYMAVADPSLAARRLAEVEGELEPDRVRELRNHIEIHQRLREFVDLIGAQQ